MGTKKLSWITSYLVPLVILALGVGAYLALTGKTPPRVTSAPETVPLVETLQVLPHTKGLDLEADGVVVPFRDIELSAEVAGKILKKAEACRAGQFVTAGSTLFEIDPSDYELEVQRLKDQLAQAEANIAETEVELNNTWSMIELAREEHELQRNELARVQRLAPRAMSESEVDKAKRSEWLSRNTLATLRNQIDSTTSRQSSLRKAKELVATQLRKAQLDVARTVVVAPVSGMVVRNIVEQDGFVQKGALLAVIEDTSKVEVKCSLRMDDLMWLWGQNRSLPASDSPHRAAPVRSASASDSESKEQAAESTVLTSAPELEAIANAAHISALPRSYELPNADVTVTFQPQGSDVRFIWEGTLSRYDGHGLDERTRTVPCRVVVDRPREVRVESGPGIAPPRALMRGMFVSIRIHAEPQASFVRVPEAALQPGKRVLRVRDNKLQIVGPLMLAQLVDDHCDDCEKTTARKSWIVHVSKQELQPGDHIVSSPLPTAYQGMPVKERTEP